MASVEDSVRCRDLGGPMSGNVPGRQDPDGVGGVVPTEVRPRVQPGECG